MHRHDHIFIIDLIIHRRDHRRRHSRIGTQGNIRGIDHIQDILQVTDIESDLDIFTLGIGFNNIFL